MIIISYNDDDDDDDDIDDEIDDHDDDDDSDIDDVIDDDDDDDDDDAETPAPHPLWITSSVSFTSLHNILFFRFPLCFSVFL